VTVQVLGWYDLRADGGRKRVMPSRALHILQSHPSVVVLAPTSCIPSRARPGVGSDVVVSFSGVDIASIWIDTEPNTAET
jgi:hypothetical protein